MFFLRFENQKGENNWFYAANILLIRLNKKFLKLELDLDFVLLAVTCVLKDYRLCYYINKNLNFSFAKLEDHELSYPGQTCRFYSKYLHCTSENSAQYFLLSNKGSEGYLVPELKSADYFIVIKEFIDDEDMDFLVSELKKMNDIQAVVELDPAKLKSKENLIF